MKYKIHRKQNSSRHCFVCGTANDLGLKAKFYECQTTEPKGVQGSPVLLTVLTPKEEHQSYPGRLHGGVAASILDEAIGRAVTIQRPDIWGVTIDLNVKYRKPVPLGEEIYCESWITKISSRGFEGGGKLFLRDGTVCVTGTAKYLIVPPDKIAPEALSDYNWFYVQDELPKEITIG